MRPDYRYILMRTTPSGITHYADVAEKIEPLSRRVNDLCLDRPDGTKFFIYDAQAYAVVARWEVASRKTAIAQHVQASGA